MATADHCTRDGPSAPDLVELVSIWDNRVKEARKKRDAVEILSVAAAAADAIEQRIDKHANWTQDETAALTAVKRFIFNAAADAWPGWELEGPATNTLTLTTAKSLAQRSADWVEKLQLGKIQEATGIWLVGALDIALGNFDDALTRFSDASQRYEAAPAPGLALLVKGYIVIAKGLSANHSQEVILQDLEKVLARISSGGFKDGGEWIEQLRTALSVFTR